MMPSADTTVVTSNTTDGIAIAFTTTSDVADLRARVRRMADMHNRMHEMHSGDMHGGMSSGGGNGSGDMHGGMSSGGGNGSGDMHGGMGNSGEMGSGDMRGETMMKMVPSRASVEDTAGGARLVLVPTDPSQLSALRTQAREHAAMMEKGECPMMETMGSQPPQPQNDERAQHHPE